MALSHAPLPGVITGFHYTIRMMSALNVVGIPMTFYLVMLIDPSPSNLFS